MKTKDQWYEFYKSRVNSTYQDYFEQRYKPMLDLLSGFEYIYEEGVGIGSVSKAMLKQGKKCLGYDLSLDMVNLCRQNNPSMIVSVDSLLNRTRLDYDCRFYENLSQYVFVTHGVLEHFSDDDIEFVFRAYAKAGVPNVHYVPTNGYDTPSFGDERLLEPSYWIEKFKPKDFLLFNEDKDLLLINI